MSRGVYLARGRDFALIKSDVSVQSGERGNEVFSLAHVVDGILSVYNRGVGICFIGLCDISKVFSLLDEMNK